MKNFKDNFSRQSCLYARYRPSYPAALFEYLNSITAAHELAWDCGTGNGQSAISLAEYFKTVYATDPSEEQIRNAIPHERIIYKVERAENPGLGDRSVDLVTVAQALHWFRFDEFYPGVKRVLKKNGVIAAWAYGLPSITAEVDAVVKHYHDVTVDAYWQPENRLIEEGYRTIPFPFTALPAPEFVMKKILSPGDLVGHIRSWSATQRFIDDRGTDPTLALSDELNAAWGKAEDKKEFTWKITLKVGRLTDR